MKIASSTLIKDQTEELKVPFLGEIGFDKDLESSIGDVKRLLKTKFVKAVKKIVRNTQAFNFSYRNSKIY